MIVPSADSKTAASQAGNNAVDQADLPPTYASAMAGSSTSPPKPKATNYVAISRTNDSIRESYLIDPKLEIPEALLPPLWWGSGRRNLSLESTHGSVDVDVSVAPVDFGGKKVTLHAKSSHGQVKATVHRPAGIGPPFLLNASSTYGQVSVRIPRSFHGPATISVSYGSVKFSDQVAAEVTTFSDVKGTRKCFIGDPSQYMSAGGKNWSGDEVNLDSKHGQIKIYFEDEELPSLKGFLGQIFGW